MQESKLWRPEDTEHLLPWVTGGSELLAVGAWNKTQILWESSTRLQLLSCLSTSNILVFLSSPLSDNSVLGKFTAA